MKWVFIATILCLSSLLLVTGCSTCNRVVKYQSVEINSEGIKIPVQIGNMKTPIDIAAIKIHAEKIREASEIVQILDNAQYQNCQLSERLPENQRAPLIMKMAEQNDEITKLSVILVSAQTSSTDFDKALGEWIKATKKLQ